MGRFEIVSYGLILFFCSILIDLCIRTLEAGKTFEWGPLSGWASAFVAMVAVGFASLSYRNSTRSLDLSNTSYKAKVIETFANRANDKIKECVECKDSTKIEEILGDFIYELLKICEMIEENEYFVNLLHVYLSKKSIIEIETASELKVSVINTLERNKPTVDNVHERQDLKNSVDGYHSIIDAYKSVFDVFKKHKLTSRDNIEYYQEIKNDIDIH